MRVVVQYRLPEWQSIAFRNFAKKHNVSISMLSRFAFSYILLKYRGRISSKLMDEIEFKARKKFS